MKDTILSPSEVREILNSDNKEIIRLCKLAAIVPRQDNNGLTYFSYDEVKRLKELRENYINSIISSKHFKALEVLKSALYQVEDSMSDEVFEYLSDKFSNFEKFFEDYEQCKTENSALKLRLAKATKENCYLKDQLSEFKPLGMGVYIKTKKRDYSI